MTGLWIGRDVNRLAPTPPNAVWTPVGLHGRGSDAVLGCKSMRCLVDLVRFELTTSSMPWKRAPNCATGPSRDFFQCITLDK